MTDFSEVISWITTNPEAALIPIALLIGVATKRSNVADGYIPVVVIVASAVLGFLIAGLDATAAIKGLVAGLITVAGHTAIKQVAKAKDEGLEPVKDPLSDVFLGLDSLLAQSGDTNKVVTDVSKNAREAVQVSAAANRNTEVLVAAVQALAHRLENLESNTASVADREVVAAAAEQVAKLVLATGELGNKVTALQDKVEKPATVTETVTTTESVIEIVEDAQPKPVVPKLTRSQRAAATRAAKAAQAASETE